MFENKISSAENERSMIENRAAVFAALKIAAAIDVDDKIETDPAFPANRSPEADRFRAQYLADHLAEYRAALASEGMAA